ncbi:MATH and LRR domain-containing protein PFE0570w-like [Penaeus monodon]|uniref:MATH and LRR domain-containing protein PFE0570w-like n=1 Tax=Penaeus monodon TaxID=6687 RepID=UPI0018A7A643|nr:MATH and LRR domain-containing protein PFE0570w-like [Penaeus monodon]
MFTLATVSVVSSLLLWTVYHNYLDFNTTQIPQQSPDWQDASHLTRDPKTHDISDKIDWPSPNSKSPEEISDLNVLNENYFEGHVTDSLSKDLPKVQRNFEGGDERPIGSKRILSDTSGSKTSLKGDTGRQDNINDFPESSVESGDIARKDNDDVNTYDSEDDDVNTYDSEDDNVYDMNTYDSEDDNVYDDVNTYDSEDDNVYDDFDIYDYDEIGSYATVGNTDATDQITEDEDKTDRKDKITDDMTYSEDDGIKGTTEKSLAEELHEKADHSLLHENKEIPNDKIPSEIHPFAENLLNISDNVIKLIVGNKEEVNTLPKKSSKMEENFHQRGRLVDGNSASILYSLTSYIFHLEINKSLHISSQTHINNEKLENLEPSGDITNVPAETQSHSADINRLQEDDLKLNLNPVQLPSSTPKPKIITKKIIKVRMKTPAQGDFMTYLKGQTWEVFVTLAAVVVGVLLLMMFIVVWGTQHVRKRENRKRLLRIQAMENQREI